MCVLCGNPAHAASADPAEDPPTPVSAGTASVGPSGDQDISGLLIGVKWSTSSLTYSFPTSASFYEPGYGEGEPLNGFNPLNATQQAVATKVLQNFAAVANLAFTFVTESSSVHGDLRYARSNDPSTAWGYYPSTFPEGGDTWYRNGTYNSPVLGNYAFHTFIHETGHALGLKHGQETDVYGAMTTAHDSMEYSVMTYRSYVGDPLSGGYANETWGYAQSLMMYDIAALQYMYGANYTTNSGNTTYTWSSTTGAMSINGVNQGTPGGNRIFMTVWDGGGTDTYDFSNYSTNLNVSLAPGGWTTISSTQLAHLDYWDGGSHFAAGNIANALLFQGNIASLVENATGGSGNDTIVGNQVANVLIGNGGNDNLSGGNGDDTISGGTGTDTMNGGAGFDTVSYDFSNENWTIDLINDVARGPFDELITQFENIIGGSGNDILIGNSVANVLTGGGGSDTFVYRPLGNTDRITDFVAGPGGVDLIDISMFQSMTSLSAVMAIATTVGSDTVLDFGGSNTLTLSNVLSSNLVDSDFIFNPGTVASNAAPHDLDADGTSDILWHRTDGQSLAWIMNGVSIESTSNLPTISTAWEIVDLGDFNADGASDVLWHNDTTGAGFIWEMSGGQVQTTSTLPTIDPGWKMQGTGNFNGDDTADILWRHDNGSVVAWLMSDGQIAASLRLGSAQQSWHVQSTGDFNGDDSGDVLWRDDSGETFVWLMDGGQIGSAVSLGNVATTTHIMNTGDFNGDGTTDIVWHTDAGENFLWQMNSGQVQSTFTFPTIDYDWRADGIGYFNNDSTADLVWRHPNGSVVIWQMNGSQILASSRAGSMDSSWQIAGHSFDLV